MKRFSLCGFRRILTKSVSCSVVALLFLALALVSLAPQSAAASQLLHNSSKFPSPGYWDADGGWGVAGGKYGEFTCKTCHGKKTGNIKRVLKNIAVLDPVAQGAGDEFPIETAGGKISFLSTVDGSADFGDDSAGLTRNSSDKICEGCHSQTKYHRFNPNDTGSGAQTEFGHYNNRDCISCHKHDQGFKPFDCFECHGGGTAGSVTSNYWPDGPTTGSGYNEEGRHKEHMDLLSLARYSVNATVLLDDADADAKQKALCAYCHAVNDDDHAANETAEVFTATVGGSSTTVAKTYWNTADLATISAYNSGGDTCSNVDCHNSKTTPAGFGWYESNTATCTMCHTEGGAEVNGGKNPNSGLHTGTLIVSNNTHDGSFDDGNSGTANCVTCHTGTPSDNHINGTFAEVDINLNTAGGITYVNGTPETCAVGGALGSCHDDGGGWARRWSTTAKNNDGTQCVNCHGGYSDQSDSGTFVAITGMSQRHDAYNATIFNKHGGSGSPCYQCHGYKSGDTTYYNLSTEHRDGSIQINNKNTFEDTSNSDGLVGCAACHASTDGLTAHSFQDTENDSEGINRWGRDLATVDGPTPSCTSCHNDKATGDAGVGPDSPHVTVGRVAPYNSFSFGGCEACHPGAATGTSQHQHTAGKTVVIRVNPTVGIVYDHKPDTVYNGFVLGGTATYNAAGMTEADICWNCHYNTTYQGSVISEWGTNSGTGSTYNYGWLHDGSITGKQSTAPGSAAIEYDWSGGADGSTVVATWSSAGFNYKTGAIQSSHSANNIDGTSTTPGLDIKSEIRCSYCHDVHDTATGLANAVSGAPYLRGSWYGNPYPEDGAPRWDTGGDQHSYTTYDWGNVPRGSVRNNEPGGYQIDQNNSYPTATGTPTTSNGDLDWSGAGLWTYDESAGLCKLCHTVEIDGVTVVTVSTMNYYNRNESDLDEAPSASWVGNNGHANAVIGGNGTGVNIFSTSRRNTVIDTNGARPAMGYANHGTSVGYGFRGIDGRSFQIMAPPMAPGPDNGGNFQSGSSSRPYGGEFYSWGATVETTTTDSNNPDSRYHQFSCSKCHNPHASRLPRLMITNCLDTQHNTWDDDNRAAIDDVNAANATSNNNGITLSTTTAPDNYDRTWSNTTSAQNCHRLAGDNRGTAVPGYGDGWNNVTPWTP